MNSVLEDGLDLFYILCTSIFLKIIGRYSGRHYGNGLERNRGKSLGPGVLSAATG